MSDPTFTDFLQSAYAIRQRITELDAQHWPDVEKWRELTVSLTAYADEREALVTSLRASTRDVCEAAWTRSDAYGLPASLTYGLPK